MRSANMLRGDQAQLVLIYVLLVPLLLMFTGLAIDTGLLYVTKAKLSSAVDAACLAGMKSLGKGQTTASTVATNIFTANYGTGAPTPSVSFPLDANNNQQVKVTATVNVRTLFMQMVPSFATVPVSASAVSTRSRLVMTLVLDRSASMCGGSNSCPVYIPDGGDSGGQALQSAVPAFVNNFANGVDYIGLVSFSANATIDVPITTNFRTAIDNDVAAMTFQGDTFGGGAGTNSCTGTCATSNGPPLNMADYQNNSVAVGANQPETKVVVYFTDGQMNTIQDQFHCGGLANANLTLLNYGGTDPQESNFCPGGLILDPTQPFNPYACAFQNNQGQYLNGFYYDSSYDVCRNATNNPVTTFPSQQYGTQVTISQTAVTKETQWRALKTASVMRSEVVPTYVFVIGLGSAVSGKPCTEAFLATLANDPSGPAKYAGDGTCPAAVYNSSLPTGLFVVVPNCPSATCTQDLTTAFQTIAAKVLLRLTQ